MKAHDAARTLAAGGIAPLGAAVGDERTSPVRARAYASGPAVIVRLEADAVAAGSDAEMAALGFGAPEVSAPLGQTRYRTLGFPAWALVHGPPKLAAAALAVAEELREAKLLAVSRPGAAKLAFEAIAAELAREAPSLLPTFWEEAGRAAAEAGSAALGAQCFERARQSERAHGLPRDADEADAVFVEFALLGALSAKTLSQYAKDLVKSAGGAEAYRRFRAIVVRRAFGGMPPYSGMGKDLAALAKAAKLDASAETAALAAELLEAPGVARAPVEFWTSYRDAIVARARGDAAMRARLRAIWPDPRGGTDEARGAFRATGWLQLLDDAGALADLPDPELGAWLSKLIRHAGVSPRVRALLAELAPRLAAHRQAISVVAPRASWGVGLSLDLAETALALGIPLLDPDDDDAFDLDAMTVDPVRVAREARYGAKLVAAVAAMIGDPAHERRMAGKAGFLVARRAWLVARLDELDGKPLPRIAEALALLEAKTTAATFAPWPELQARLGSIEIADGLAVQLRGGLADELAWPAYERALAKLSAGGQPVSVGGAFPTLVMWNAQTALAIDHTGVVAEHDLVYRPKEQLLRSVWFLAGAFLVVLKDAGTYEDVAYWSSAPKERFPCTAHLRAYGGQLPSVFALPDGRVSLGGKAFRPGDTVLSGLAHWVSDGTGRMWTRERATFVPYDPAPGARLAGPPPPWLQWSRAGHVLYARQSSLRPAPAGLARSPLGLRDGVLGLRVRVEGEASVVAERIDGVRWTGPVTPLALVDWPGDTAPRPIDAAGTDTPGVILHAPTGVPLAELNSDAWAAPGWGLVPPAAFWHYLSPRDPAGSAALRVVTLETARALIAGTPLAAVTHPLLVRGVDAHVAYARELAARLAALVAARSAANVESAGDGFVGPAAQLRRVARALEAGRAAKLEEIELDVLAWVRHGRGIAMRAMSPVSPDDDRAAARELLRALSGTALAGDGAKLRLSTIARGDRAEPWNTIVIEQEGASSVAIHAGHRWALELSRDGVFRGPARCTVSDTQDLAHGVGTAWVEALLARPDAPLPLSTELVDHIAAAGGTTRAVATLLWAGAPELHAGKNDFLGKAVRDQLGLTLGDASRARTTLRAIGEDALAELFDAAAPAIVSDRFAADYADGLARAWAQRFGDRPRVPAEVTSAARRGLRMSHETEDRLLSMLAGDHRLLPRFRVRAPNELEDFVDARGPDASLVEDLMIVVGWAFMALPVGDPFRAGIADLVDKLRGAAEDPEALWTMDAVELSADTDAGRAKRRSITDLVPGGDDGALVVRETRETIAVAFRPAKLTAAALKRAQQMTVVLDHLDSFHRNSAAHDLRLAVHLRSPAFAAFASRVRDTPVPDGGYEANPLASVPKLVAQIAKTKKLPRDAAALYLQTLALAEPTQRDVCAWNGWTSKHYAEVAARLVKAKLVVGGKRPRFGRPIFLPGGYTRGDDGLNLPVEESKLPLYDLLARHVPAVPLHLLFARAWNELG